MSFRVLDWLVPGSGSLLTMALPGQLEQVSILVSWYPGMLTRRLEIQLAIVIQTSQVWSSQDSAICFTLLVRVTEMSPSRSTMPYINSDWHWSLDQTCDLPVWILYEEHNIFEGMICYN